MGWGAGGDAVRQMGLSEKHYWGREGAEGGGEGKMRYHGTARLCHGSISIITAVHMPIRAAIYGMINRSNVPVEPR